MSKIVIDLSEDEIYDLLSGRTIKGWTFTTDDKKQIDIEIYNSSVVKG